MSRMRISVKQICMFGTRNNVAIGGCPRLWGFNYLDKLEKGFLGPQLVDGIKFHKCVEHLHRDGVMPTPRVLQPGVVLSEQDVRPEGHYGRMARAALVHVPRRAEIWGGQVSDLWVHEHVGHFPWTTSNGVEVDIDLRPDLMSVPQLGVMAYLVDFKGTGNKRHALTNDSGKKPIREDVQANVYSYGLHMLGAASVLARWIYVDRNTYASWPVERLFQPATVVDWLHENIDATVELIHSIRSNPELRALDLPGDEESPACGGDGSGRFCDFAVSHCFGPVGAKPSRLITLEEVTRFLGKVES